MKINANANNASKNASAASSNSSRQGIVAGGCYKSTPDFKLPGQNPKDSTDISQECRDEKHDKDKDGKCDKKGEKSEVRELIDLLKELFGDKDDEKSSGGCGGGGQGGGGQCGGGGQGGGGCGQAGGVTPSSDNSDCGDPIKKLERAVKAVECAKDPQAKAEAKEKLKKQYEKLKEDGTEIPEELKKRVERALSGSGTGPTPTGPRESAKVNGTTKAA